MTITFNSEKLKRDPQRISKNNAFLYKYSWDGIKFEKINPIISFNDLYIKEMEIRPVYIAKINSDCQKLILLMIPNEENQS